MLRAVAGRDKAKRIPAAAQHLSWPIRELISFNADMLTSVHHFCMLAGSFY